jgi:hypothetical protein
MKCKPCQRVGMWHCSDVEHCGNMKMMTPAQVRRKALTIKKHLDKWNTAYKALQQECQHPNKDSKRDGTGSMWCKTDEAYWINHYCPDCDKRWTEDQ